MIETNENNVFMRDWAREMKCKLINQRVKGRNDKSGYTHYVSCSTCIFYGTDVCKKEEKETKQ